MNKNVKKWLDIELLIDWDEATEELVFDLLFVNKSNVDQALLFANRMFKAERYGLTIRTIFGWRIRPVKIAYVRPDSSVDEPVTIKPGQSWRYRFDAKLEGGELRFLGCAYQLACGKKYVFSFEFREVRTRKVKWRIPCAPKKGEIRRY